MTPAINGSVFTYELAPVFTLMENDLFEHMRKIIGWDDVDGTMCPGGSFANFMGLHLSRSKLHPEFNKEGIHGKNQMKYLHLKEVTIPCSREQFCVVLDQTICFRLKLERIGR